MRISIDHFSQGCFITTVAAVAIWVVAPHQCLVTAANGLEVKPGFVLQSKGLHRLPIFIAQTLAGGASGFGGKLPAKHPQRIVKLRAGLPWAIRVGKGFPAIGVDVTHPASSIKAALLGLNLLTAKALEKIPSGVEGADMFKTEMIVAVLFWRAAARRTKLASLAATILAATAASAISHAAMKPLRRPLGRIVTHEATYIRAEVKIISLNRAAGA
jgi:hypothetical protein